MAKKYRVELKPLEPYFFAGEKSFGFGKKKKQSYNNYFIRSELFPTQTTLLGTIRYLILKKYNLLTRKDYSNEKEQEKYVGKSSFQIGQKNQSYGMIERLSPLFILNEKGERLVRVPFNQQPKSDDNLKLRSLKEKSYPIFDGSNDENNNNYEMKLLENVNLKKEDDVQKLFYNIDTDGVNKLIKQSDIVNSIEKVGINLRIEKEAFFKKEYQYLIKGYRFGFYLEINDDEFEKKLDDVIEDIVYMGSGKSAFKLVMSKTDENIKEFIDQVKEAFKMSCDDVVYYAMSDIIVDFNKIKKYCYLVISDVRTFRNLIRNNQHKNYFESYKQSNLYNIIRAGSVFFVKSEKEYAFKKEIQHINYEKIGFNKLIKIGGVIMATKMYMMKLETNLHVGNGDINYNIIDNEVEKDVLTEQPIIYSSGMKGAFREYFTNELKSDDSLIEQIFGSKPTNTSEEDKIKKPGELKFFDGYCLLLSMRNSKGNSPYSLVTTKTNIEDLIERMNLFEIALEHKDKCDLSLLDDSSNYFIKKVLNKELEVEGNDIKQECPDTNIKNIFEKLIGKDTADIVIFSNEKMNDYNLPVIARNVLEDKISKNLWYEEFVPYQSYFYTFVNGEEDLLKKFNEQIVNKVIQFGANESIGYGLVKITEVK